MTTVNATIASPRLLLVGGGTVRQIAEVLGKFGLSRPLVVSDPIMVSTGLIQRAAWNPLAAAGIAVAGVHRHRLRPHRHGDRGRRRRTAHGGDYDCLIGFGGGSPIDTAKAMAILAAAPPGAGQDARLQGAGRRRQGRAADHRHPHHRRHRQRVHPLHRHHRHRTRREDADRRPRRAAAGGDRGLRAHLHACRRAPPPIPAWTASPTRWRPMSPSAPTRSPMRWRCRRWS